nr:MAG TPA: hypothetical protein [Caudoviricetes sp.]
MPVTARGPLKNEHSKLHSILHGGPHRVIYTS